MGVKVVINVGRYGRYGWSWDAIDWLAEHGNTTAQWCKDHYRRVEGESVGENIWRTEPMLAECIEALGERAYTNRCVLKVVELPDDVGEWQIDEVSKGIERIIEVGRSWE